MSTNLVDRMGEKVTPVRAVLAALLIGALGSGIWSWAIEPSLSWFVRAVLSILTLGMDSLADAVYIRVSRGLAETIDILIYYLLLSMMAGAIAVITLRYVRLRRNAPQSAASRPNWPMLVALWLILSPLMGSVFFYSYINNARLHFQQSLAIVAPYLDEDEEEFAISEFAQINSRNAYMEVMRKLRNTADANDLILPPFTIW